MNNKIKKIAILGSTGSIGTQALDVISKHKSLFEVEVLTANNNAGLLIKQAEQHNPNFVVICNEKNIPKFLRLLTKRELRFFVGRNLLKTLLSQKVLI